MFGSSFPLYMLTKWICVSFYTFTYILWSSVSFLTFTTGKSGKGLYLNIGPTSFWLVKCEGSELWILRCVIDQKRQRTSVWEGKAELLHPFAFICLSEFSISSGSSSEYCVKSKLETSMMPSVNSAQMGRYQCAQSSIHGVRVIKIALKSSSPWEHALQPSF